ncbi:MAG: hypothetical protein ACOCTH_02770 [Halodesulfurarchaeum sp.]
MTAYGEPPVEERDSVEAADNDAGLAVELDAYGRPFVNLYYSVSDDAEIDVQVRNNADADWRTYDTLDTAESDTDNESLEQFPWLSYNHVRATTETTDVDVTFELAAGR